MQAQDVLEVVKQLERAGVVTWLDGGWGVDALVGRQTRPHDDVDVVIALDQACLAVETLRSAGYVVAEDELLTRFVMQDDRGRTIDFHPVTFDQQGDGLQQLPDGTDFHYPREGFAGAGSISDQTIRCITAQAQILCHLGYEPDEKDIHDMQQLRRCFHLDVPAPYG